MAHTDSDKLINVPHVSEFLQDHDQRGARSFPSKNVLIFPLGKIDDT